MLKSFWGTGLCKPKSTEVYDDDDDDDDDDDVDDVGLGLGVPCSPRVPRFTGTNPAEVEISGSL